MNPKHITSASILIAFCFCSLTCKKKIEKYPFKMEGVWFSTSQSCSVIFVIEKDGNGKMSTLGGHFCSAGEVEHGVVKYKKDILYIGSSKFTFTSKPIQTSANDTIYAPYENDLYADSLKKYKTLAEMTLSQENNSFSPIKFYKYLDY